MGNTPPSPPPPPPKKLTDKPWREPSNWNVKLEEEIKKDMKEMEPKIRPNLLLIGPVGAGKSSFVNSILSIGKRRKVFMTYTAKPKTNSCTLHLQQYNGALVDKFNLFDSMGIEPTTEKQFYPEEIFCIIQGYVKNGYTFNPLCPIQKDSKHYRKEPKLENETHCAIFVLDANALVWISQGYKDKIKILQGKIQNEHIPRILILTKADELCGEVKDNITNLFRSTKVLEAVNLASDIFDIEVASIHPVINYERVFDINTNTNIPLLLALRQAMGYAEDRIEMCLPVDNSVNDG